MRALRDGQMWLRRMSVWMVLGPVLAAVVGGTGARASAASARCLYVKRGVLTVDGPTVRTGMAFSVTDLRYRHLALPGSGTAVVASRLRGTGPAYVRFERGAGAPVRVPVGSFGLSALAPSTPSTLSNDSNGAHRLVKVKGRRAGRTAKLCTPTAHGPERCATVHEVLYTP